MVDTNKEEVTFNKDIPQKIELVFEGTGEKGAGMPDSLNIKIQQVSSRQLLFAAISLMNRAFKEFESDGQDIVDYLTRTFIRAELGTMFIEKVAKDVKKEDKK